MPIASRRKTKQSKKKNRTMNVTNQHSSLVVQGSFVSENRNKMEDDFNGTLHDTQKVEEKEEESLSEENEVAIEVSSDDVDGKSKSLSDEHVESCKVVEEKEDVSEKVFESLDNSLIVSSSNESSDDAIEDNQVENIVASEALELELKEDNEENLISLEDNDVVEETELSKDNNEDLRENEVVETIKDMKVVEKENVLSSKVVKDELILEDEEQNSNEVNISSSLPSIDVVSISREIGLEKSGSKSDDEGKKGIEESLVTSTHKKVEEQLDIQESSSYEIAKESFQLSSNVHDSESTSVTKQDKVEESRSIESPVNIFPVTQRQHTSWKSCCGLFEILRHGER